jgi:WD40 repeat protein
LSGGFQLNGECVPEQLYWVAPYATLSCHNNSVAVGSEAADIIILNAITGSQSAVLSGHSHQVMSVTFSSDGTSLVSGSIDMTVKLWDIQTGGVVKTFFGHTGAVISVSISADYTTIASGSSEHTICLWNIQTGECCHTIQQEYPYCLVFSPKDPQHLISISDSKVWWWNANGYQIRPPLPGVNVTFSSDGAQLISCFEKIITVHNSNSGKILTKFQVDDDAHLCSLSPGNRLVAVAVKERVYCWDITTSEPQLVETFVGHTRDIISLIFSSPTTLISASFDRSIKFWQIGAQSTDPTIIDLQSVHIPPASIESVTLQSKEGIAITSDSDGVIKTWDISTGICKTSFQTPVKASHKRDTQLVNGRLIFIWYRDEKICAQDAENGELLQETYLPWGFMNLRISGDGSMFFGLDKLTIWAWSLHTGEVMGRAEIEHQGPTASLIVDGSKVWVCWSHTKYKGWDFGTPGSTPVELSHTPTHYRFWDPEQAKVKNPATGEVVFRLPNRSANPSHVQCDGSYLVAGYQSGEVLILDLTNVK